jgi:VanZ family protein
MSRFNRRFRALLFIALAVSLLAFLQFFQPPRVNRLWLSAMDAGHVPLFGVFALAILGLARSVTRKREAHPLRPYALAFVITSMVSALTEILQYFGPRDADVVDLARSVAGAAIFLLVVLLFDRATLPADPGRRRTARAAILAAAIVLLGAGLASFVTLALASL